MKKGIGTIILGVYLLSTLFFYDQMPAASASGEESGGIIGSMMMTAEDFGMMCISSAYPGISAGFTVPENEEEKTVAEPVKAIVSTEKSEKPVPVVFGDDPAVLIVHTHATESYLPASEGNYHTTEQENSVRDVGKVLAEALKTEGIAAVHDQTIHDNPSYGQSYSRSYETIQALLKKYPTICCVIDLHRDAVASDAPAATVSSGGRTCAKYSYVVSNAVETYSSNLEFIKNLNKTAADNYNGFSGKILERGYRYNQNLSDKYILLEIGYNRNDITEARNTAEIFAGILADTLKAGY